MLLTSRHGFPAAFRSVIDFSIAKASAADSDTKDRVNAARRLKRIVLVPGIFAGLSSRIRRFRRSAGRG
ncbi:UNVERIFIED_CONTAM: hypothetical protein Q9R58_28415 [Methylobacteriaceae bacterium AG10]|nr:hypothetical protein [Methylobacteriaceae bacterium AG10]